MLEFDELPLKNLNQPNLKLIALTNKDITHGVLYYPTENRVYHGGILLKSENYQPKLQREGYGWQMIVQDIKNPQEQQEGLGNLYVG